MIRLMLLFDSKPRHVEAAGCVSRIEKKMGFNVRYLHAYFLLFSENFYFEALSHQLKPHTNGRRSVK